MEKLTNRDILNYMLDTYSNDKMVVDYATHQLELLDKKNASRAKSNEEDIALTDLIINVLQEMTTDEKTMFTITEILKNEKLVNYVTSDDKVLSNSKVTSLLRKEISKDNSRVVNVKDKKNSFYGLV